MAEAVSRASDPTNALMHAKKLMEDALNLLDDVDAAADIGAHLDMAIHRLTQEIDQL